MGMAQEFEWDEDKSAANLAERGIDFAFARRIFADPDRLTVPDTRHDYGEDRFLTAGHVEGRMFVAVWTKRGDRIRIISVRKANVRERGRYGKDD